MQSERKIVAFLGGDKVLHHKVKQPLDFDRLIREGFPWEAGMRIKETLCMPDGEFAKMLGISVRTLSRHKAGVRIAGVRMIPVTRGTQKAVLQRIRKTVVVRMPSVTSDRLYRLARIYAFATEVLEDADKAMRWLRREQIGLGGRVPLDMIQTEAGEHEVENLLGRMEYGVLA